MMALCQKGYDVLVGDCYGVDASVQRFYSNLGYCNITVFLQATTRLVIISVTGTFVVSPFRLIFEALIFINKKI